MPRSLLSRLLASGLTAALAVLGPERASGAINLPPDFTADNAVLVGEFDTPIAIAFLPDGRYLVGEKRGVVWMVTNGVRSAQPVWDGQAEVLNQQDRGLLDIAVHPGYLHNHYVYFLYTVDPDGDGNEQGGPSFGRLTRYQVGFVDSSQVDPASRTVLIGDTWANGPLIAGGSHTVGSVRFGRDTTLLVSTGDGALFDFIADPGGLTPDAFLPGRTNPVEDIGAFRSQSMQSLAGKFLRIDPITGAGLPSNPYWDGNPMSVRSRVWAYGVRNSFRMTVRPGTGSTNPSAGRPGHLVSGDVGWVTYEEMNYAKNGGENFGWPCREGLYPTGKYDTLPPARRILCSQLGTFANPAPSFRAPSMTFHHDSASRSSPPGTLGNASVGGAFYTGTRYPVPYRGKYFHADFGQSWIMVADLDTNGVVQSLAPFATAADGPVDLEVDPVTGDIYFCSIYTSSVRRLRYNGSLGGNLPPVAVATATPSAGDLPLLVQFSGAGSSDPEGSSLAFTWTFGDGNGSIAVSPSHTYTSAGTYWAVLTVEDSLGGVDRDSILIQAGAVAPFPSSAVLDDFERPNGPPGPRWLDAITTMNINGGALMQGPAPVSAVFDSVLGASQEAWLHLTAVTAGADAQTVLLKIQGTTTSTGMIEVRHDADEGAVRVTTYAPGQGWRPRGGPFAVTLSAGDTLGARATGDGTVFVYHNGDLLGACPLGDFPFSTAGGRVGIALTNAPLTRIEDFGGGTYAVPTNTAPSVSIGRPDTTWAVAGDTLSLAAIASDAEQDSTTLEYRWDIDLHHNTHVHPSGVIDFNPTTSLVFEDHDDGTGVFYAARVRVRDAGGLADSDTVRVFPEIDLDVRGVHTLPASPPALQPFTLRFHIGNSGGMRSHVSRWRVVLDGALVGEANIVVNPLDSMQVEIPMPAVALGSHEVRIVADSLANIVEPDEGNNAFLLAFEAVNSPPAVDIVPGDTVWVAPGDTLALASVVTDLQDPEGALLWQWAVDQVRVTGVDSAVFTSGTRPESWVVPEVGDSVVVRWEVRGLATDSGALSGSDTLFAFADVDLSPRQFSIWPSTPSDVVPIEVRFHLHNRGRMTAPPSHWRVLLDGLVAAEGDTSAPAGDSVLVTAMLPALALGPHSLRVAVDTLGAVVEPDESDNAAMLHFTVVEPVAGADGGGLATVRLAPARPNPASGAVRFGLELPRPAEVQWRITDMQGRTVWSAAPRHYAAGRWDLLWDGRAAGGSPLAPGLYLARVQAGGDLRVQRFIRLK